MNVTARGASNEFEAEAWPQFRPGRPPDSGSPYPRRGLSGNPVGDSFERAQYGGSLGLPLVTDRTFLNLKAEYTRDTNDNMLDAPALGVVGNLTGHNTFALASARLDHRLNDDWRATFRVNHGRVTIERPGGSLGGGNVTFPSAGSDQDRVSTLLAAGAAYSGSTLDYEASLLPGAVDWDYRQARATGPQVTVRDVSGLPVAVVGHPGFAFDERERTLQLQQKLRFSSGDHRWLVGGAALAADFDLRGGGNADGNYVVDMTPAQLTALRGFGTALTGRDVLALKPAVAGYGVELRPSGFGRTQTLGALYAEDRWSVRPDLTVSLGLRWDYDSLTGEGGGKDDLDNFCPRLSVRYQPDARTVIRAGAGLFVDKLTYSLISDALQRNTTAASLQGQVRQLIAAGLLPADTRPVALVPGGARQITVSETEGQARYEALTPQLVNDTGDINFRESFVGNSDRYPGVSRNAARLPWSKTLDHGARYALPVGRVTLEASLDVFNLLDAHNESGFANAATTSNQIRFGGGADFVQRNAAPPRQFQLGLMWKM